LDLGRWQGEAVIDAREWRLESERRYLDGRLKTLDRQLEPYDRNRLRSAPLDEPTGRLRNGLHDPIAGRLELERRALQDRQRIIERERRR
jgi:hypothetical protein